MTSSFVLKIVLCQSYTSAEEATFEVECYRKVLGEKITIVSYSVLDGGLSWKDPAALLVNVDAVIIGGSSEFDFDGGRVVGDPVLAGSREILERVRPLVEYVLAHEMPCFGVCFGHQLIAAVQGAAVRVDGEHTNFGSYEVRLNEEGKHAPLFSGMPAAFIAQFYNRDVVTALPRGAVSLGQSRGARFAVLR